MFRIKICGVTSVEDARIVVEAGADAVGLNFFPKSPRYVELDRARAIADALSDRVVKVGLFVNAQPEHIVSVFDSLRLDLIQLHGDEPPEFLERLGGRPVMRAFRLGRKGLAPIAEYLWRCSELGCPPQLTLIDSHVKGKYGGTGVVGDWAAVAEYAAGGEFPPLVLAGGLTSENVVAAIRAVGPLGVDTASGVEASPGRKDAAAVVSFVRAARSVFGGE